MKQQALVFAATASLAYSRCRINCPDGFTKNEDICLCQCLLNCVEPNILDSTACECYVPPPEAVCGDVTCENKLEPEKWQLNLDSCVCEPADGVDPCDDTFNGAFTDANGNDCPGSSGGTSS